MKENLFLSWGKQIQKNREKNMNISLKQYINNKKKFYKDIPEEQNAIMSALFYFLSMFIIILFVRFYFNNHDTLSSYDRQIIKIMFYIVFLAIVGIMIIQLIALEFIKNKLKKEIHILTMNKKK